MDDAITAVLERDRALEFARSHDWGRNSYLSGLRILGLADEFVDADGVHHVRTGSVMATLRAVREFGEY